MSVLVLYTLILLNFSLQAESFNNCLSPQNATAFAYLYGYPLLAFQKLASGYLQENATNQIDHGRTLATAADTTVVRPNTDTIYSTVIYDLSETDLLLEIPKIPASQFALFSFYDPFGDNYVNIGTGNFNRSGTYWVRKAKTRDSSYLREAHEGTDAVATVYCPTTYGVLLIRWLLNATNQEAVHSYQNQTIVREACRANTGSAHTGSAPALTTLPRASANSSSREFLDLVAAYAPWNEPLSEPSARSVKAKLQRAGLSNGTYRPPSAQIDYEEANRTALANATAAASARSNNAQLNNGWSIPRPGLPGIFDNGTNYAFRTSTAGSGYLMLQAPNAVYTQWQNSSSGVSPINGQVDLGPSDAYIYTFSRRPPLLESGFWSLTVYADNYLIPNPIGRYAVGDRSNLTFPDGKPVYSVNKSSAVETDGIFQILIQPADVVPPSNWTNNWIPGPNGGGMIQPYLRWYGAQEDLLNGTYQYPIVSKRAAIRADN